MAFRAVARAIRMNLGRRAFLVTGVLGGAALVAGGWLRYAGSARQPRLLDADARAVVTTFGPAFLAGALPQDTRRVEAIRETVDAIDYKPEAPPIHPSWRRSPRPVTAKRTRASCARFRTCRS